MPRGGKREGAGRKVGSVTTKTREVAERVLATGMSPLDVMINNMRHFQQVALDAEATLEGLSASEFSEQIPANASPEEQFKFLLATVKKTVGLRQAAQDAARDAAPYVHAKLASVEHKGEGGGPLVLEIIRFADKAS